MAITYENVLYDFVMDPLRDLFITEYNYGKIYIAPSILNKDPFPLGFGEIVQKQMNIMHQLGKNNIMLK